MKLLLDILKDSEGRSVKRFTRLLLLAVFALAGLASTACFQQSNTYPVEVFHDMHYAQFNRPQEPPRLVTDSGLVAYQGAGGTEAVLSVPAKRVRPYDSGSPADVARAGDLYRVNCSVCHGVTGAGDGPAAAHINSPNSFFATVNNGARYASPPSLQAAVVRQGFGPDQAFATISSGIKVMPRFSAIMSEEDIRDVVNYLFDAQNGIASKAN